MTSRRPTRGHIDAVHRYLAREFPNYVQRSWWDEDAGAQIFEIENGALLRRLVMDWSVFWECPDAAVALSISDLGGYLRAVHLPSQAFAVMWHHHNLYIRAQVP